MTAEEEEGEFVALSFTVTEPSFLFVAATVDGGRMTLEQLVPRGDGRYSQFFSASDVAPERVLALTEGERGVCTRTLARYDDGALFEFTVGDDCPAVYLVERGAIPGRVDAVDGRGYLRADVPPPEDAAAIVESFLATYPSIELTSKRHRRRPAPLFTRREVEHALFERLTDRQREVLLAAFDAGYYEWPRQVSGEDLADRLDISGATLHEHLRRAESTLVRTLLDRPDDLPERFATG